MKTKDFYGMHTGPAFWIVLGLVCIFCCVGCGAKPEGVLVSAADAEQSECGETEDAEESLPQESGVLEESGELYVYVCGQVRMPGVYVLPRGARICDAIEAAGGFSETAATDYWNLARVLEEDQMIAVPTREEAAENGFSQTGAEAEIGAALRPEQGGGISSDGRININKATREELMTLPGIGQAKADSIIEYRETNGLFSGIRDIMNVPGIKEGLFQKVENYITAE